jgi:hypothetical protein
LHSGRNAPFDERARPSCCASINHGGDASRRDATGGGQALFLPGGASLRDATLPWRGCIPPECNRRGAGAFSTGRCNPPGCHVSVGFLRSGKRKLSDEAIRRHT